MAIGIVLVAGEPAEACQGWPLCDGTFTAPSDGAALSGLAHRVSGLALLVSMGAATLVATSRAPGEKWLVRFLCGAFILGLSHAVLGGLGVAYAFPSWITAIHMGLALGVSMLLVGVIASITSRTASSTEVTGSEASAAAGAALAICSALIAGAAIEGARIPLVLHLGESGGAAGLIQVMFAVGLLATTTLAVRSSRVSGDLARSSLLMLLVALGSAIVVAQIDVGAYGNAIPAIFTAGAVFPLGYAAFRGLAPAVVPAIEGDLAIPTSARLRAAMRDLARVTKPGIMLLLLTTTFTSMLVASRGWPGGSLVLWTLMGGALASGGASAMNCYLDRDVDQVMARTRKRPIPTGTLSPDVVRGFALVLSVLSALVLTVFVNPLAALLAVAGNVFYVMVYTMWLKRSTPQNIVIGGAAGSFPPLVGWAAATGSLGIAPLLLALIVFYWTPPHFWGLALLKANDYRRAGIPMLPVTHGEEHT
ncbi:MAG: heme o synthase, partial [Chloroflexota bacterium]